MAAVVGLVVALVAPAAYAFDTAGTAHTGAIPTAGPAVTTGSGRFGGFPGGGRGLRNFRQGVPNFGGNGTTNPFGNGNTNPFGNGNTNPFGNGNTNPFGNGNTNPFGNGPPNFGGNGGARGGLGGLLDGQNVNSALKTLLQEQGQGYRWVAATVGANNAASYQLASGKAIMAIGGFNGTDPTPTLAQFEQYVHDGDIHYFIGGGGFGGGGFGGGGFGGGSGTSSQIASWVANNFTAQTVGGVTIYDLSSATSSANATVSPSA